VKCRDGLDEGGCCCYHCSPPLYLYFLDHCKDGAPPKPLVYPEGCKTCGTGHIWSSVQRLWPLHGSFGCGACGCH
jgi:hypothetical protein